MRHPFDRFVLEVDPARREKNEKKDEGDHHIVVKGPALVRPEDVAANCAPQRVHRQRGNAGDIWLRVNVFQVY